MKVLAFNSSPHMDKGNTALILNPFLDGTKEAGAEVELIYTKKLNVKPCLGCYSCWLKTPGKCAQKDDMAWVLPKMREADVLVIASPLYFYDVSGPMKNLMDRSLPLSRPFMEVRDGRTYHAGGDTQKPCKLVLVSNCGFWEKENFDVLLFHVKTLCQPPLEFAGALLRPHGEALKPMLDMGAPVGDVIAAAREAGRQLVKKGRMSPKTLATVSRELLPLDMYVQVANQGFKEELEKLKG